MFFDIYNPTRATRIIYPMGGAKELRIRPGETVGGVEVCEAALSMIGDLEVTEAGTLAASGRKRAFRVVGMFGIGDNVHQRAVLRELMKTHEVWLEGCMVAPFLDLHEKGLHITRRMRAGRIGEKASSVPLPRRCPPGARTSRMDYHPKDIKEHGSILKAQFASCGLKMPARPDFSLPVPQEWRERAKGFLGDTRGLPVMVYRPITVNGTWHCPARAPDPHIYRRLYDRLRGRFYTVSVADLRDSKDTLVGTMPPVDVALNRGQLDFEAMAGLFAEASLVLGNPGFSPALAQAVGTPVIILYGGNECYETVGKDGAHLAPTLPIEPRTPCACHHCHCSRANACRKDIDVEAALAKLDAFVAQHIDKPRVLIFGTTFVDTERRSKITKQWRELHGALNPDCDLLLVDSVSPISDCFEHLGPRERYFSFADNIGHLSRNGPLGPRSKGQDGWGRAFVQGLSMAIDQGYDYVVHIEGDSLFRLPVMPIINGMRRSGLEALSTPVVGTKYPMPNWIESGLMFFETKFVARHALIAKYNWPTRKEVPSPEAVLKEILAPHLKEMPWKAWRGDKNEITPENILDLDLDWVTHCRDDPGVFDRFFEHAMPRVVDAPAVRSAARDAAEAADRGIECPASGPGDPSGQLLPSLKLNLGCGSNKLQGWSNHDADVDISKPLPFSDGSAAYILAEHVVEHIPYKLAIEFFKEAHRVLARGGVLRVCVPSLEQIGESTDPTYHQFTSQWQKVGPTAQGAMHAIIHAHGHETVWTASLLKWTLIYCGFEGVEQREPGHSDIPALQGVEGHGKVIGDEFNAIESCVFEATKGGGVPMAASERPKDIAIVFGGAEGAEGELAQAIELCRQAGHGYAIYAVNDQIMHCAEPIVACTLHPDKLQGWLSKRRQSGFAEPSCVFCHRVHTLGTKQLQDWGGSSGLFAFEAARHDGFEKVIFAGVPMSAEGRHFIRRTPWTAVRSFIPSWQRHMDDIKPYARSMSGWTQGQLGAPDAAFLVSVIPQAPIRDPNDGYLRSPWRGPRRDAAR